MKTILVPTDFSENAEKAMDYALMLAKSSNANIVLLHAWELPHQKATMFLTIKKILQDKARQEILKVKELVQAKHPDIEIEAITMMGDAAQVIKRVAKVKNVGIIVMGTRGATGLKKIVFGSNAAEVIDGAPCPVLAIPHNAVYSHIKTIAFATNAQQEDIEAIQALLPVAEFFDAEILVTHIADLDGQKTRQFEEFQKQAKEKIDSGRVAYKVFAGSDVYESLISFISSANVGLVAMAKRKKGFFESLFGRSLTKEMAYSAKIPLLAFQPGVRFDAIKSEESSTAIN
jgi:nucleotide-binding universal stress UspA family protein